MKVRAAVLWEQGHEPDDEGPLVVEEVDLDGPGPGELLVRITAAGLCHSDLSAITGDRPEPCPPSSATRRPAWWRTWDRTSMALPSGTSW